MNTPKLSRREFFLGATALGLSACAPKKDGNISLPFPQVQEPIASQVGEIIESHEVLFGNMKFQNHQDDIRLFAEIFNKGVEDASIVQKLIEFQSQNGLTADANMGPETLKVLYTKVFIHSSFLSHVQQKRWEIYTSLQNYEEDRGKYPSSIPNPFDNTKYFGGASQQDVYSFLSIPGTYLTQGIYDIPVQDTPNTLYIERNSQGKMILRMYDMTGNLYISAYVTGGTSENQSPENLSTSTSYAHLYHVSSSYPEESDGGAPMYAATQVNTDGIWIHSSASMIDGYDHSHGCFRVGLLYAQALHDYVNAGNTLNIVIGDLYS